MEIKITIFFTVICLLLLVLQLLETEKNTMNTLETKIDITPVLYIILMVVVFILGTI